jgi:hypothetical protein
VEGKGDRKYESNDNRFLGIQQPRSSCVRPGLYVKNWKAAEQIPPPLTESNLHHGTRRHGEMRERGKPLTAKGTKERKGKEEIFAADCVDKR